MTTASRDAVEEARLSAIGIAAFACRSNFRISNSTLKARVDLSYEGGCPVGDAPLATQLPVPLAREHSACVAAVLWHRGAKSA